MSILNVKPAKTWDKEGEDHDSLNEREVELPNDPMAGKKPRPTESSILGDLVPRSVLNEPQRREDAKK